MQHKRIMNESTSFTSFYRHHHHGAWVVLDFWKMFIKHRSTRSNLSVYDEIDFKMSVCSIALLCRLWIYIYTYILKWWLQSPNLCLQKIHLFSSVSLDCHSVKNFLLNVCSNPRWSKDSLIHHTLYIRIC